MHFVVLVPFWFAVVVWVIRLAQAKGSSNLGMVQRTIKAPDGRVTTFTVPGSEPVSVSIARMYPNGVIPTEAPQIEGPKVIQGNTDWQSVRYNQPETKENSNVIPYAILGVMCLFVIGALAIGKPATDRPEASPLMQRAEATPPINALRTIPTNLERVRLKTGANIRNAGSRNGAVLRVANQGDILIKFAEVNGWLQVGPVGAIVPEGWVALSTVGAVN